MAPLGSGVYNDTHRMRLRGVIFIASEIVALYWPMRMFVKRNPLHGLEDRPFEEAVRRGCELLGGKGYLANALFREHFRSGRIVARQIDAALKPRLEDQQANFGQRELTHAEVLRTQLLRGIPDPAYDTLDALLASSPDRPLLELLCEKMRPLLEQHDIAARQQAALDEERAALGRRSTLAVFCDRVLGTEINQLINREMIKWCEGFLDEGHAPWQMPGREKGFYGTWKWLAAREWSACGISDSKRKLTRLSGTPEDSLLESLDALGIPSELWPDYLSRHLTALPGWAGFIKWRTDQADYKWQEEYPADLVQYLAVRLWYERELVQKVCKEELGVDGNREALAGGDRAQSGCVRRCQSP